ncbi:MAG: ribonucleoside-triphosphate reductase, adenosylcobalamin-dependent [Alkaliphilus sp.]
MVMVRKRPKKGEVGKIVSFDKTKISKAILSAMILTDLGADSDLANKITDEIANELRKEIIEIEEIQDLVVKKLMSSPRQDVAINYILHRDQKQKERKIKKKDSEKLISDEFISKYKHLPNPMSSIGTFVFYRTYSRYLPQYRRREFWHEVVRRIVDYNCSLVPTTTKEEAEELYDNIFNLRQFMSGRTNWIGNTPVSYEYPMANFNCAFKIMDSFEGFPEIFYLSMVGAGVGLRMLKEDIEKLPAVRIDYDIIHEEYVSIPVKEREDSTSIIFKNNNLVKVVVGDSKEGWMSAIEAYFNMLHSHKFRNIKTIIFNYNNVRPKGEVLKKMGGTASGHESIKTMFVKIDRIIKSNLRFQSNKSVKLKPINVLDICTSIGENVVSGGVRRTAQMIIISPDDNESINAKTELYKEVEGKWIKNLEIAHREMSNNSIMYTKRPTRERLHWQIEKMRFSGEPAWINKTALLERMPEATNEDIGLNPCGEAALRDRGLCNLTSVNLMGFVADGKLDVKGVKRAFQLATRVAYRMTCVTLELPKWDTVQKENRLLGVSFMGWLDMVNATNLILSEERELLKELKEIVRTEADSYADSLGLPRSKRTTAIKPEGTQSNLPQVSSGIHYAHSPYYIRRIRISDTDPLVKVCRQLEYPVFEDKGKANTVFIEFPCKSPEGKTKNDVSAIEQLERYLMYQECFVDHNTSITVHVRDHEWNEVEEFVYNNWDRIVAVSFISHVDNFYEDLPYESIDEMEYKKRLSLMKPFNPLLIGRYEKGEEFDLSDAADCESGVCPIR